MGKATITHVENGYIVELTRVDVIDRRPVTTVLIFESLKQVVEHLEKERL